MPDIDEPNSYIGRRSLGVAKFVKETWTQRSYSLFCGLDYYLSFVFYFPVFFLLGISMGYLFHLMGDYFTHQGVRLFLPFDNKRYKAPFTFKVGSSFENVIFG